MRLRTCFITFNYLLALLAISCLILGEVIPLAFGILALTALGTLWVLEWKQRLPVAPPRFFSLWKLGAIGLPLVYFLLRPQMLSLVAGFLLFVLLTRFLYKTELNDYLYGYLVSIVCLLIGAIFTQDFLFALMFLSFYLILCWALMFYHMMAEKAGTRSPPEIFRNAGTADTAHGSLFGMSSFMILVSLMITATIFMSFPRFGLGFLELATDSAPITGFSDQVRLGDVGRIKQNQSVVMRVQFRRDGKPYRPVSKVLWRGVALDHYDGKTWRSTMPMVWRTRHRPGTNTMLFHVPNPAHVVELDVYMEAFDSPVIFTYGVPMRIDGTFERLQMDEGNTLKTTDNHLGPRRFSLVSETNREYHSFRLPVQPDLSFLQNLPDPHLQLPAVSDKLKQLAGQLGSNATEPERRAARIENFLLTQFEYSMDMKRETQLSAVDEFLFVRKAGHCEYFASAMVLLLRLNGIPARLVNGFMGTEWNEMGDYMIVRQAHAHSWVEAYFPGKGWKTYDPTPPDPRAAAGLRTPMSRAYDLMRLYWQRYIVKYSARDQVKIMEFFNRGVRDMRDRFDKIRSISADDLIRFFRDRPWIWAGLALLGILLWVLQRRFTLKGLTWVPKPPYSVRLYRRMLDKLEKRGIAKPGTWTHREFLEHLDSLTEEQRERVRAITLYYEKRRFGNEPEDENEKEHLESWVRQL